MMKPGEGEEAMPKPSDLIPLSREVKADDTMRDFQQVLRFDIIFGKPLRAQLLLDRRHKIRIQLSKPAAYVRMSQTSQLVNLACGALSIANVLAYQSVEEPSHDLITSGTKSLLQLIEIDVATLTEIMLRQIKLHRMAVAKA